MKERVASNIEWKRWGDEDPLMGVATRKGRGKHDSNPWTVEEFYELGRSDWSDFFERWKRYGVDTTSCLEIGCGTGRYTRQIAGDFRRVFALDVSEGMIEFARQHISAESVTFLLGDGTHIALGDASVTAAFSAHVFQHFDSLSYASSYVKDVARVLAPSGSMMLHLPVHRWPAMPQFFNTIYHFRKGIGDVRAWMKRQLIRAGLSHHHFMRGLSYPVEFLFDFLPTCGFENIEIAVFATSKENSLHPFVLARRASRAS
jgi:SAM-dependent methyltransferase